MQDRFIRCVAVVVLASGCANRGSLESDAAAATLSIGLALPAPGDQPTTGIRQVAALLTNEQLVSSDNEGRAVSRIAESWECTEDGRTWRFFLREGVRFHNNVPVTADLVADALRSAIGDPGQLASAPSFEDVETITSEGSRTVVIRLKRPTAFLLSDLYYVDITLKADKALLATGPFLVRSRENDRTVLERFDAYHRGKPAIQRVELRLYETVRKAWAATMRGEVDFLYEVGPDAAEFVQSESSVRTFSFLRGYTLTLGFNLRHPVLRSRAVRQALNRAVDRDAIVRAAFRGRGRTASYPIWPNHWALSGAVPTHTHNVEAARLGFASAGYGEIRDYGPNRMRARFRLRCLVYPPLERAALVLQKQLFHVGVDLELELVEIGELIQRLGRGDYDTYLFWQASSRSLTWPYVFWHSPQPGRPSFVQSGYNGADAALDGIRYARNDDELRQAVSALQRVMYDDPPAVFIAWDERVRAVSRKFEVPQDEPGRDIVASIWRWKPATSVMATAQ
jgi:peptide/nickel transport system substrate-binding protein